MATWNESIKVRPLFNNVITLILFYDSVENESKLKVALSTAEQCIEKHDKEFEGLYNFCYPYAKSENQKSMDVEVCTLFL